MVKKELMDFRYNEFDKNIEKYNLSHNFLGSLDFFKISFIIC